MKKSNEKYEITSVCKNIIINCDADAKRESDFNLIFRGN